MSWSPRVRKGVLAVHLAFAVGWVGGVAAYLVLGLAARWSDDPATVRGAWVAMELIGWSALVPLAVGALVTGVLLALGTRWGLIRHYWVLLSLVLTVIASLVLVLHMPTVSAQADLARTAPDDTLDTLAALGSDLFHPGAGLAVLLLILVLNVDKPAGLTRYGWRRQRESASVGTRDGLPR